MSSDVACLHTHLHHRLHRSLLHRTTLPLLCNKPVPPSFTASPPPPPLIEKHPISLSLLRTYIFFLMKTTVAAIAGPERPVAHELLAPFASVLYLIVPLPRFAILLRRLLA